MQRIGITERGDASISFDWINKMHTVSGAILITKNITDKFIKEVLNFKNKVIIQGRKNIKSMLYFKCNQKEFLQKVEVNRYGRFKRC